MFISHLQQHECITQAYVHDWKAFSSGESHDERRQTHPAVPPTARSTGAPEKPGQGALKGPSECRPAQQAQGTGARYYFVVLPSDEQDSHTDPSRREILGGGALTLTEHCQNNFILFTNVYRLITNVKYRMPEEMQRVSFSHLVKTSYSCNNLHCRAT